MDEIRNKRTSDGIFFHFYGTSHNSLQYCLCLFSSCYVGHRQTCLLLKNLCILSSAIRTSHAAGNLLAPYLAVAHHCYFFQLMRCARNCIFLQICVVIIGVKELECRLWKLHMNGKDQSLSHFSNSVIVQVAPRAVFPSLPPSLHRAGLVPQRALPGTRWVLLPRLRLPTAAVHSPSPLLALSTFCSSHRKSAQICLQQNVNLSACPRAAVAALC